MQRDTKITIAMFIVLFFMFAFLHQQGYGESRLSRGKQDLFIETTVGGHIPTLLAIPLKIGYYESPDILIGLEYASREFEYDDNSVVVENGKINNEGVFTRYFFSGYFDSFNILTALNRRRFEVDVRVNIQNEVNIPFGGDTKYTISNLKTEVYTFTVGIGNQWQWNNGFHFGIDWYCPSWILAEKTESEVSTGDSSRDRLTRDERSRAEDDLDDFGDTVNGIAGSNGYGMITVGWSF